ncbi:MAG: efflux RND transporter periplasmic adaptor subunit [Prevotellaceae bacterium]|jgi:RND family efflux transporter MFP subunit|nr:efflux RND transporter periplasmic adaptor subunit [Prevotellaceae bacterium]
MKAIVILLLSIIFLSCASTSTNKNADENNPLTILPETGNEVSVMMLAPKDFHQEIMSNGTISATQKADLYFESVERIENIYVKNGDVVNKGQQLASLDLFKIRNEYDQAKDNLERAKLELQDALISQGYLPSDSLRVPDEIMKIAKIKSNYDQSTIQYELSKHNLDNAVLRAPFSGVVANLFLKEHNTANTNETFCSIVNNSSFEVIFYILESELSAIQLNDKVQISPFAILDYSTNSYISEINPSVDKNGMVWVKASINDKIKNLYDGMNVKVKIQQVIPNQLVIPKEALVLRSNKEVVFTLKNEKAQWVYVQTGLQNSTEYIVVEGLNEGDSLIYEGNLNLAHEAPVKVRNIK